MSRQSVGPGRAASMASPSLTEIGSVITKIFCSVSSSSTPASASASTNGKADPSEEGVSAAVVAIGEDQEASILCTAILKRLGVPLIVARANSELHGRILEMVGATRVIYVEEQVGEDVGMSLIRSNVLEWFALPTGHTVAELAPSSSLVGKALKDLPFRQEFGVNVISLKTRKPAVGPSGESLFEEHSNNRPGPDDVIREGDTLVVVGPREGVEALSRSIAEALEKE